MAARLSVAVIGAGYAGLAAAVELAAAGAAVEVFEASRTPGGRARAVEFDGLRVDNGAHILVGAYGETLRLMRRVGADATRLLRRTPLHLEFPGEFRMRAPRLPSPLHTALALLLARGLDAREKLGAIRLMRGLQANGYRIEPDRSVADWLEQLGTPPRQRRFLWEPLCIAALNTPAADASAQVLASVTVTCGRSCSSKRVMIRSTSASAASVSSRSTATRVWRRRLKASSGSNSPRPAQTSVSYISFARWRSFSGAASTFPSSRLPRRW